MALLAGGVPAWRIGLPVIVLACGLSLLVALWSEFVVPHASKRSRDIKMTEVKGSFETQEQLYGRWFHVTPQRFVHVREANQALNGFSHATMLRVNEAGVLAEVIQAEDGQWEKNQWTLKNAFRRQFERGEHREYHPAQTVRFEGPLDEPVTDDLQPWDMSYRGLVARIQRIRDSGGNPIRYLPDLHAKVAFPFMILIMVSLTVAVALRIEGEGFALNLGILVGLGLAYYAILAALLAMGRTGMVLPHVAAWLPNILFAVLTFILFRRTQRV
jgi:lipopolysaccharide export system permease protein